MKTLADIKKRIQVGVKMHCTFHRAFMGRTPDGVIWGDEDKGTREVSIRQTNSFALKTTKTNGEVVDSWCQYPKASLVKIVDDNTFEVLEHDDRKNETYKILTYKFVD